MMNGYFYDVADNSLTVSASFNKKAAVIGSPEYEIIVKARKENPGLKIKVEAKKTGKAQITFAQMERFINLHSNREELMKQYNGMRSLSKIQPSPYTFMKKWFENTFPYFLNAVVGPDGNIIVPKKAETLPAAPTVKEPALTVEPAAEAAAA